jgi:hypothetical protein
MVCSLVDANRTWCAMVLCTYTCVASTVTDNMAPENLSMKTCQLPLAVPSSPTYLSTKIAVCNPTTAFMFCKTPATTSRRP